MAAPPPPPPPPPSLLSRGAPPPSSSGPSLSSLLASHNLSTGDTGSTGSRSGGGNPADEAPSHVSYSGPSMDSGGGGGGGSSKPKPGSELMSELAMAIGAPRNYSSSEERNPSIAGPKGYRAPASVKMGGGTQGHDKVAYSLQGPQVAKVQSLVTYLLHCKNETKTDYVDIDGDIFEAELTATAKNEVMKGKVEKERKGVFKVSFRGRYVGEYTFNVWVKGALEKRPIFQQPIPLKLIPGDPIIQEDLHFVVTGWGMHGGTVGKALTFDILVKNAQGQPIDCDSQRLVAVLNQGLKKANGFCQRQGQGKYQAEFTPPGPGEWIITVEYAGQEVCSAKVQFNFGIDAHQTEVVDAPREVLVGKQNTFIIQAKGQAGGEITTGGEKFEVGCSGPKGGVTGLVVRDELTGKYTVRFTLTVAGQYKFFISLRGTEIKGSPLQITAK